MLSTANGDVAEVPPVDLALLTGQGLQTLKGLGLWPGTVVGHLVTKVVWATAITTLAHHRIETAGGEVWELLQGLVNKGKIGIDDRGAARAFHFRHPGLRQYPVHYPVVYTQLPGNGTHPPLLYMVVTQNLCLQFFVDSQGFSSKPGHPPGSGGLRPNRRWPMNVFTVRSRDRHRSMHKIQPQKGAARSSAEMTANVVNLSGDNGTRGF